MRLKYSGIKVTKEVRGIDKKIINGSVVDIGDEFEYVINISNSSLSSYDSFIVNENISDYVNVIDINNNGIQNKSVIRCNINSLKSGDSIQLVYKVKVKNNLNNNKLIDISLDNLYSGISITISPKLSNDLVTKAIVKGDVTGFGNADINDASKISDYLLDKNEISDYIYLNAADYDNNGKINIKDIIGGANDWLNR